jgi:hypothetical protein
MLKNSIVIGAEPNFGETNVNSKMLSISSSFLCAVYLKNSRRKGGRTSTNSMFAQLYPISCIVGYFAIASSRVRVVGVGCFIPNIAPNLYVGV